MRIFLARTYSWDKMRTEAKEQLHTVLQKSPADSEARQLLIDLELQDEHFGKALELAVTGLSTAPADQEFLYQKALALKGLGELDESAAVLVNLLRTSPGHVRGVNLLSEVRKARMKYTVGTLSDITFFSRTFSPIHQHSLQLARDNRWGSSIVKMNLSHRSSEWGVQPEIDLYPKIAKGVYGYFNYGFSESRLFPRHRYGAEVYTRLPASLEASAGMRYLYFGAQRTVSIYTGSVGLYAGNYWISLRPYLTPHISGTALSSTVSFRRYFQDGDNYVGLTAGAGFSPDDRRIRILAGLAAENIPALKSQRAALSWQKTLKHQLTLNTGISLVRQELSFERKSYVLLMSANAGLRKRF